MTVEEAVQREHRREQGEEEQRHAELERERLLERQLLVRVPLLDVLVGDPDLLDPHEGHDDRQDESPYAELLARQEAGDGEASERPDSRKPDLERRVDDRAARCPVTKALLARLQTQLVLGVADRVAGRLVERLRLGLGHPHERTRTSVLAAPDAGRATLPGPGCRAWRWT